MPDLDLIDLLSADHRSLVSVPPGELVAAVMQHLSVERDLLFPAIRDFLPEGHRTVEELAAEAAQLEQRLAAIEAHPVDRNDQAAREELGRHIEVQEPLFAALRQSAPAEALVEMAGAVPTSIGGAPSHPHPGLTDPGPLRDVAEGLAGAADHLRDKLHGDGGRGR